MTDYELMQQALYALEYASDMTKPENMSGCGCPICVTITALRDRLAQPEQPNDFNPDWDAMAVMVEEQQRMAKRIAELEAQPEQEPVAWMVYTQDGQSVYVTDNPIDIQERQRVLPLYPTPPQRPWVGLTEPERLACYDLNPARFASAIENSLKEKNT